MSWVDEIQFADPAINLLMGNGWTSSVWISQHAGEFWAGNAPLYSGLLVPWLSLFGVSALAVRSLNILLMVATLLALTVAARRCGLIKSGNARLLFALLFLTGHGINFGVRMGRYDMAGLLLCALIWLATTLPSKSRGRWIALASVLLPAAGLQLLPLVLATSVVLVIMMRRRAVPLIIPALIGVALGALALYGFFQWHGVWNAFRQSTSSVGVIGQSLGQKLADMPHIWFADKSECALAIAALLIGLHRWLREKKVPFLLWGALVWWLVLALFLQLLAKFPIYYHWMTFIPLALVVASFITEKESRPFSLLHRSEQVLRLSLAMLMVCAVLVGLPLRLLATFSLWDERDPEKIAAQVNHYVGPEDNVMADFKIYYPTKLRARKYYAPTYLKEMTDEERSQLTLLIMRPLSSYDLALNIGGGVWIPIDPPNSFGAVPPGWQQRLLREFADDNYALQVYRKRDLH